MPRIAVLLLPPLLACSGKDDTAQDTQPAGDAAPTWSADLRPVIAENCTVCHFEGGSAPFALETHQQASSLAAALLDAVEDGRMPPWNPDPSCREYQDERVMSADDQALLRAWVEGGALEGEPTDPIQVTPDTIVPTHTLVPPEAYTPDVATEDDDYHCFVFDETFDDDLYMHASQIQPDTSQVHHVLVYALTGSQIDAMESLDAADEGPGYSCFGGPVPTTEGESGQAGGLPIQIGAWVPGANPIELPEDQAVRIPAGARIVMQVHYHGTADGPTPDATSIQLVGDDLPPEWLVATRPLGVFDLDIPAGEPSVVQTDTYTNWSDEDLVLRSLAAHMHLLGVRESATLTRLDGATECLMDIPDWDFDWQQAYLLPEDQYVTVGPGESVTISCEFDNSAENQPVIDGEQVAPEDTTWGEGTRDEMCLLYLGFLEPFTPTPDPSAAACAPTSDCIAACDPDSWDCLLSCEALDSACLTCAFPEAIDCAFTAGCTTEFLAASECLEECAYEAVLMAGTPGRCAETRCPTEYAALLTCADPYLSDGSCDAGLAACGVSY